MSHRYSQRILGFFLTGMVFAAGFLFSKGVFSQEVAVPLGEPYPRYQEPEFLNYDELKVLSQNPHPGGKIEEKLNRFWNTPIISNEAYYNGVRPPVRAPVHPLLGPFLRVISWNIEKSFHIDKAIQAFTAPAEDFDRSLDPDKVEVGSEKYREILKQRSRLMTGDIYILQEMDIGIKRSGYIDAARELAKALNMNYAYGAEQLEVDPVILGLENIRFEEGNEDSEAMEYYRVDPARYKGAFGVAVLSRYPIKHVELHQLKTQPYDWHSGEKAKFGFLEQTRRFGAKTIFKNEITREIKVGGRNYFRVDLDVPGLPNNTLTIINVHLEIKCQPEGREQQMTEILSYIKGIKNPLIMMGDFNSAPSDISSTSIGRVVKRTAKNPTTWFGVAANYLTPYGLAINTTRGVSNTTKNFNDPFAKDIKVVAPNPTRKMFEHIRDFIFDDAKVFDFRGDPERSVGNKSKFLANSNQRGRKGFKTTFSVKRPLGLIGKYRLDWVFVKSFLTDIEDSSATYRLAPHFGETLEELNTSLIQPVSDHHPNVVDLPLEEPKLPKDGGIQVSGNDDD